MLSTPYTSYFIKYILLFRISQSSKIKKNNACNYEVRSSSVYTVKKYAFVAAALFGFLILFPGCRRCRRHRMRIRGRLYYLQDVLFTRC